MVLSGSVDSTTGWDDSLENQTFLRASNKISVVPLCVWIPTQEMKRTMCVSHSDPLKVPLQTLWKKPVVIPESVTACWSMPLVCCYVTGDREAEEWVAARDLSRCSKLNLSSPPSSTTSLDAECWLSRLCPKSTNLQKFTQGLYRELYLHVAEAVWHKNVDWISNVCQYQVIFVGRVEWKRSTWKITEGEAKGRWKGISDATTINLGRTNLYNLLLSTFGDL